jgi:AAA family ATP:ADP antiporter
MATNATDDGRPRGPLDKLLNIFTDVRGGEGLTALFLFANVFLLLSSYYLLKTIREPLVLAAEGGGAEIKSYASAAIAVLPARARADLRRDRDAGLARQADQRRDAVLRRLPGRVLPVGPRRRRAGHAAAGRGGAPPSRPRRGSSRSGVVLHLGRIFNLMIIAQFWAFANDVYTVEQGKRLFALVALGASLGAIAGSFAAKKLIEAFGPVSLMGLAAVMLVGAWC